MSLATCAYTSGNVNQPYTCTDPSYTCFYQNFDGNWGCGNQVTGNLYDYCFNAGFAQTAPTGTLLCPAATPGCITLVVTSAGNDGPLTNYECGPVATEIELLYSPTNAGAASTTTQGSVTTQRPATTQGDATTQRPATTQVSATAPGSATTTVPSNHSSGSPATSGGAITGYTIAGVVIAGLAALAAWSCGCVQAIIGWLGLRPGAQDHRPTYEVNASGFGNIVGRDQYQGNVHQHYYGPAEPNRA